MKKIFIFILTFFMMLSISSCKKEKTIDLYENVTLEETEEMRLNAISKVENSTVLINYKSYLENVYSTAFIYKKFNKEYFVITNYNSNISKYLVKYYIVFNDDTSVEAELMGYDVYNGVSCFKFTTDKEFEPLEINDKSKTTSGTKVFTIASEKQTSMTTYNSNYRNSIYDGVISGYDGRLLRHTALPSKDFLGSPLIDYEGNLVGMNVDRETDMSFFGFNYAISSQHLSRFISSLESAECNKINRPTLDLKYYEYVYINDRESQTYNLPEGVTYALYIAQVSSTSSFYGLVRTGDLITKVNDYEIKSSSDFVNILALSILDNIYIEGYRKNKNVYEPYTIKV